MTDLFDDIDPPVEPRYREVPTVEPEPTEPAYAAPEDPTRRGALAIFAAALAALPFLGGLFAAMRTILAPVSASGPARVPLCRLRDLPESGLIQRTVTFPVQRGPKVENVTEIVFVTRDGDAILALSGRCTHQGCPVSLAGKLAANPDTDGPPLVCPCHDGAFSAKGEPAGGPPKQPLARLPLEVPDDEAGTIFWVRGNE